MNRAPPLPPLRAKIYDALHKGIAFTLVFITGTVVFDGVTNYMSRRSRRQEWEKQNLNYQDDPFYMYNPNFMRFKKYDEEEILMTRPMWYAAKELREKHGIPLQAPYAPIENALMDMNGNLVDRDADGYLKDMAGGMNQEWSS